LIDEEKLVIMSTMLIEGCGFLDGYDGIYDLRFGIRTKCLRHNWKVTPLDFGVESTRLYIPRFREKVRQFTIASIETLVLYVNPKVITMSTFYPELPDKALIKYRQIEKQLVALGYLTRANYRDEARLRQVAFHHHLIDAAGIATLSKARAERRRL
jgi:hypothetical protein